MRARTKWLLVGGLVLFGILACVFLGAPRQPRYQGRSLDDWLSDLSSGNYRTQAMARIAIKEIGPAAVPFLTDSLAQRNALSLRIYRKNIFPRRIVNWVHQMTPIQAPVMESQNAARALQMLGPEATNAIPALIAAMDDTTVIVAQQAGQALGAMGSNAVPAVSERLSKANASEVPRWLQVVALLGTNAAPMAPQVAPLLLEDGNAVWAFAQAALGRMGGAAVPEVARYLQNTNQKVQLRALAALTQIGLPAASATNALIPLTTNENPQIRLQARQAFCATMPSREIATPVWLAGLDDPDSRNVEICLRQLTIYPTNVRMYNREIARLAVHPTNSIRQIASNALTIFRAWPK
jgi:hypothetical protein